MANYNKGCPKCRHKIIKPSGYFDTGILLVGEFPGEVEIANGIPFTGGTGKILEQECYRVGINFHEVRKTNLWLHKYEDGMEQDDKHLSWHLACLLHEIAQVKHVLLMGSELSRVFLNTNISGVCGLTRYSNYCPQKELMFTVNPAACAHRYWGEFRLSMEKFARRIHDQS